MVKEYIHTVNVPNEVEPIQPDFAGLVGFEDQILPALPAGVDGATCGLSNIAPQLSVGLVMAFEGEATSRKRRGCTGAPSLS